MTQPAPPKSDDYYRAQARRLRQEALSAASDHIRKQLLALAADYEGLAETVETIIRQRGG